ncbi:MAG TPA: hypothetical protein DDY71_16705 [Spirochaetia bacterium]|nr:MAG: hypothetical protein A2Y29_15475 [Spirochaetes bacterium GWE2_31_10]HBD94600.1 hypothetical protein [Spirochaetia bacterium]HBI39284.1 hypothetical protein [Spirochaetia bacterium]
MFKNYFLLLVVTMLFFCGCLTIEKVDSNFSDDEFEDIYGKTYSNLDSMDEDDFDNMISLYKRSILEDNSLSDDDQEKLVNDIKTLKFEDNKYFYFTLINREPLLKKSIDLKFNMYNSKNENILSEVKFLSVKFTTFLNGITFISYRYFWVLKSNIPITEKNIDKNNLPIYLEVIFPNSKNMKYSLLK